MSQNPTSVNQQDTLTQCILKVAGERDKQAFEQLFEHYVPLLRAYSLAREPGADLLADELAQEVMIKLWDKAATYKPERASLNTWVFTLARNARIDHFRRNGRFASNIDPESLFERMEDSSPGPFQQAQQQRLESNIKDGLAQLPSAQAEVLQKVYMEGKSHLEASSELQLPLGTIKSRIRLALKKLETLIRR